MRAYNMAFVISLIGGVPLSILLAIELNIVLPIASAVTFTVLYSFRSFKRILTNKYKKITGNLVIFLNISLSLLIVFIIKHIDILLGLRISLCFIEYINFIFYICILQDLVYKYTHTRHKSIFYR